MASKSSSSSETDTSSDELSSVTIEEEEESDDVRSLIDYADDDDDDLETEEDSDDYVVPEYLNQFELRKPSNFFEKLGVYVPDIEELSEDITEDTKKKSVTHEGGESLEGDTGVFVDPLTGEDLAQTPPMKEVEEEETKEEIEEEEVEEVESEWESDSELTFPDESEEVIVVAEQAAEEAFGAFLDMQVEKEVKLVEQVDFEKLVHEREIERERKGVVDLLESLIDEAVRLAEFVSPEMLLRQNVDKFLLMREIRRVLNDLQLTKDQSTFLNRKCVDYFKRKKSYRSIAADNPKTVEDDKRKLKQNLNRLDVLLEKEKGARNKRSAATSKLQEELQKYKEEAADGISQFEIHFRKALQLERRPNLNKIAENLLKQMDQLRKEISEVRFKLITTQHTEMDLVRKLSKFDNFENVNTKDLENMCITLNNDLKKLRMRCRFNIHTMAHYMEKQKMLSDTVRTQKLALEDLNEEKLMLRKHVFKLKLHRTEIRNDIKQINFQNSLIDKPILMTDFDRTLEKEKINRIVLIQLRNQKKQLDDEIAKFEKKCN